jgi:S-adenosylmethionine:tRNA ribosyltransferase-isomerase
MRIEDFDFELPAEQIAQAPAAARDASRLMVLNPEGVDHRGFADFASLLREGDLLVVNDAKVIPARLLGKKVGTGGRVELLLVRPAGRELTSRALEAGEQLEWICLGQASKGLKVGARIELGPGAVAEITQAPGQGEYQVRFELQAGLNLSSMLEAAGKVPLPPYIEREPTAEDQLRYQTVYASAAGSVAAPTAGLHFTPESLRQLEAQGVRRVPLTLDVGPGTFLPVRDGDIEGHRMHPERFTVPEHTAREVAAAKREGRRVVAVGTTVVRALESAATAEGAVRAGPGETSLFIKPGYVFQVVDALLTNFHLPRSTLVMLVSAFGGRERVLSAYRQAVQAGYRFFSYGDAMFLEATR